MLNIVAAAHNQASEERSFFDFSELVAKIRTEGDRASEAQLIELITPGLRSLLQRKLNAGDVEDAIQDVLVVILKAVREGALREPAALISFVKTVATRFAGRNIGQYVRDRQNVEATDRTVEEYVAAGTDTPEAIYVREEKRRLAKRLIDGLKPREKEVLYRFYIEEQTKEQICADLDLTDTQFRLMKSRAKAKIAEGFARTNANHRIPTDGMRPNSTPVWSMSAETLRRLSA